MVGHTHEAVDQMFNKQLSLMIKNLSKGRKRAFVMGQLYHKLCLCIFHTLSDFLVKKGTKTFKGTMEYSKRRMPEFFPYE